MSHRYFIEDIQGQTARLAGQEAKHLAGVLRAKPGQTALLCNGSGTEYDAVITAVEKDAVEFSLSAPRRSTAEPALWAEVFIGMAKGYKPRR